MRLHEDHAGESSVFPGLDCDLVHRLLVSRDTLARMFEVSPATISRWSANGTMPASIQVGGKVRWNADAIRDWIEGGCEPVNEKIAD